uniref:Sema domain, immunoglobulin domain (Ig), short basic domain, secreted, (semaphorin) 3Ab n=1 Tax=Sinocyclocheilus grahami TaxID=75366 RepID=A0A672LZZ9_SINGR
MDYLWGIVLLLWTLGMLERGTDAQRSKNNVPRLKLSYKEMLESNNLLTFNGLANSSAYHSFLLDEERGRLFVGAKDHVLSFNLVDINLDIYPGLSPSRRDECKWAGKDVQKECSNFIKVLQPFNQTHLYVCGTGAFHPVCAYVEVGKRPEDNIFQLGSSSFENGRGKCPYDPKLLTASMLIGFLYHNTSAMHSEDKSIKDPRFISVHLIPESDNPEDDKIYLFFRENAIDGEQISKATHARIGQLCKNDFGGHRSLVNKWTTFLKARLICSVPGLNGIDTHFDELHLDNCGSAVCMYSMADIRRVFLGPFAHRDGPNYQWVPFLGRVPYPRPGTCPSKTFDGFESTKDFPDDVITFARSHPAMYNPVFPINNRPIIIKTDVDYQFTQIVVDRVEAEDGQYDVMFIGTDMGTVLKVVSIPRGTWHDLEEVLLEEMTVFRVVSVNLSALSLQQQLYLGSTIGVSQMPLHRCDVYGKACAECCLARDPYCAWDGSQCSRYFPTAKRRTRRQDIRNGDPLTQCSDLQHHDEADGERGLLDKTVYGVENSSSFLECSPKSQRALIYWQFQRHGEDRKQEIKSGERVLGTEQGLLIRTLHQKDSGVYYCHAVEHGFIQTLLRLTLNIIPTEHLDDLLHRDTPDSNDPANGKMWYRDFLSLINPPSPNSVDQLCEQVWKRERKQRRQKANLLHTSQSHASQLIHSSQSHTSKWKLLQENKKGRNRRTHEMQRVPRSV